MLNKTIDYLGSLKLALILMILIAVIITVGTFVESASGTAFAQYYIYKTTWFSLILFALFCNVLVSALQRLPYKSRLLGFYLSHLGILILLIGSFITASWGIDGGLELWPQQPAHVVQLTSSGINVMDPTGHTKRKLIGLSLLRLLKIPIMNHAGPFTVVKVLPFAERAETLRAVEPAAATTNGYRFRIESAFFKQAGQILGPGSGERDKIFFGPLTLVHLGHKAGFSATEVPKFDAKVKILFTYYDAKNQLQLMALDNGRYVPIALQNGGTSAHLPWMNIQFIVTQSVPYGQVDFSYKAIKPHTDMQNVCAALLRDGKQTFWLASDQTAPVPIDRPDGTYHLWLQPDQIPLPFSVRLDHFHMDFQPGTDQPASFESHVTVKAGSETMETKIYMNHPLKQAGFTLYQASYFPSDQNNPEAEYGSVLSVNRDPGRWIKYLGSFLIVFGVVVHWTWCRKSMGGSNYEEEAKN